MSNVKLLKYRKLYGRICEKFGSQKAFAEHIGVSEVTVSGKLRGKIQFSRKDIIVWCNSLDINTDEVGDYFFSYELSKNESVVTA